MTDDVGSLCSDRESWEQIADALLAAFSECDESHWIIAVRALDKLIASTPPRRAAAAARGRLNTFVRENADLLVSP